MKKMILLSFVLLFVSCGPSVSKETVMDTVAGVQTKTTRYKSSEYLSYDAIYKDGKWFVSGETSITDFSKNCALELEGLLGEGNFDLNFKHLPEEEKYLRVVSSVTPLRRKAAHSAEQVDQAIMGTELLLLKKDDFWWLVKTPYNYVAYVARWAVKEMDANEHKEWKSKDRIIYTESMGKVFQEENEKSEQISDIVLGAVMEKLSESKNWYEVRFTEKKTGFIPKKYAMDFSDKQSKEAENIRTLTFANYLDQESVEEKARNIEKLALSLKGVPYLWGGSSPKGFDCSGYTQTLYKMSGIMLPRDAHQQRHQGKSVTYTKEDFSKLQKGDLLFFGPNTDKITHVGVSLGKDIFIHCSGDVHMSSFSKDNEELYSEYLLSRLQDVKRIL